MWRLNTLLNNQQAKKNNKKKELGKYLETNQNINRTYQYVWGSAKTSPTVKCKAENAYIKKKARISNLSLHLGRKGRADQTQS